MSQSQVKELQSTLTYLLNELARARDNMRNSDHVYVAKYIQELQNEIRFTRRELELALLESEQLEAQRLVEGRIQ